MNVATRLDARVMVERWPLREPFAIAREVMRDVPVVVVILTDAHGHEGRAEAAGVDYDGETPELLAAQIREVTPRLAIDTSVQALAAWLPAGGARNALDCALLDLRAKATGVPVWQALGLPRPGAQVTAITIGLGDAAATRRRAATCRDWPLIKVKVSADAPVETVRLVRDEAPAARLVVDANESWTLSLLERSMPPLHALGVELIEQPLPRGGDDALAGLAPPMPIAADESCTDRSSLDRVAALYQAINIKLDKCGGLTEAVALAGAARERGLQIMVGNMCGSSLAMAPAFLLSPWARWLDLDGPLLQIGDRPHALHFDGARLEPPEPALWG